MIKVSFIGCAYLALVSCASVPVSEGTADEQVAYVSTLHSFHYIEEDRVREVPESDEIIISNGCGEIEVELHVLASSENISKKQTIHQHLGEWCQTPFDWRPFREWLVIAEFPSMQLLKVYPVENNTAIVDQPIHENDRLNDDIKSLLRIDDLENAFPYPFTVNLAAPSIRAQYEISSGFKIIDGELFVVKGINLKKVFGDY